MLNKEGISQCKSEPFPNVGIMPEVPKVAPEIHVENQNPVLIPKKRGRPKGSKNKSPQTSEKVKAPCNRWTPTQQEAYYYSQKMFKNKDERYNHLIGFGISKAQYRSHDQKEKAKARNFFSFDNSFRTQEFLTKLYEWNRSKLSTIEQSLVPEAIEIDKNSKEDSKEDSKFGGNFMDFSNMDSRNGQNFTPITANSKYLSACYSIQFLMSNISECALEHENLKSKIKMECNPSYSANSPKPNLEIIPPQSAGDIRGVITDASMHEDGKARSFLKTTKERDINFDDISNLPKNP